MAAIAKRFQIELEMLGFTGEEKLRRQIATLRAQVKRIRLESKEQRRERRQAQVRASIPRHLWSDLGLDA
jgi:hypothetical protein